MQGIGVCVDYDHTFTAGKEVWTRVIVTLREAGANVFCITSRFPDFPVNDFPGEVYYACGQLKWEYAHENGLAVHIWIDDHPVTIGEHPERRGQEGPQATQRKQITSQVIAQLYNNRAG